MYQLGSNPASLYFLEILLRRLDSQFITRISWTSENVSLTPVDIVLGLGLLTAIIRGFR